MRATWYKFRTFLANDSKYFISIPQFDFASISVYIGGSMSIVERIKQIEKQEGDLEKKANEAYVVVERKRQQELEQQMQPRKDFVASQIKKINDATNVINMLQELDSNYWVKNGLVAHGIYADTLFEEKTGQKDVLCLTLVWRGNETYKVKYDSPRSIGMGYGYSRIRVKIYPDSETICVEGKKDYLFKKEQWIDDPKVVKEALAKAFLYPWSPGDKAPVTGWF